MLRKLQQRARDEKGFTLIELLVVILIIGILAAIAIPSFINQRSKGQDANAKAGAKTAAEAQETYFTDNQSYTGVKSELTNIEPTLNDYGTRLTTSSPSANEYVVNVTSQSSDATVYTITRNTNGTTVRTCDDHGSGGCRATADAAGNYW
jgi:type IV pilus assembly protein PilA